MYQNACYHRPSNTVYVWDDLNGLLKIPYQRYAYKIDPNGKYLSIDDNRLTKVTNWSRQDELDGLMYESDVLPVTRTLIDLYYESDEVSINHRILFIDIETETEGGYGDQHNDPWQPITAIGFYDQANDQRVVLLYDKDGTLKSFDHPSCKLYVYDTEIEMLKEFLAWYQSIAPTIVSGWNIDDYDIPYVYNRLKKVLGKEYADILSPIGYVTWNKNLQKFDIGGVTCLDYLQLYKKLNTGVKPSYKLDDVSLAEIGEGKIAYDGTLAHLFREDPVKFVEYNIQDVILVYKLDQKFKYIALAMGMCHKGHVTYDSVYMSTRYLDGACLTYLKRQGLVGPNKPKTRDANVVMPEEEDDDVQFEGAFVKHPQEGLHLWTFDIDMAALYPSVMRTLNISYETLFGVVRGWSTVSDAYFNSQPLDGTTIVIDVKSKKYAGTSVELEFNRLREWLQVYKFAISTSGAIYDLTKEGIIPQVLSNWMQEREDFRALVKKEKELGNLELATFYDNRQAVAKVMNNSLYGALGNKTFRFYELINAESVTLTGQAVIMFGMHSVQEWFTERTGVDKDYIIYVDTDSIFTSAMPVIRMLEERLGRTMSWQERADISFKTAVEVEKYVNSKWSDWVLYNFNATKHFYNIKQEYVSEAGFWVTKKRYVQKIISEKGVSIEVMTKGAKKYKLDVKGLEVVRSDFPIKFRKVLTEILGDILDQKDKAYIDSKILKLRDELTTFPLKDIAKPTSVRDIKKWTTKEKENAIFTKRLKGTPVHVKSALNYNDMINHYKLTATHEKMIDGSKLRWVYLSLNPYRIDTIGFKGYEDPEQIMSYLYQYLDYDKLFDSTIGSKLQVYYDTLKWGRIPSNDLLSDFF